MNHLVFELKSGEKGDQTGSGRDTIQRAVTQALRGMNGFANHFRGRENAELKGRFIQLIPAVFTTAKVFTSEVDISSADLQSGVLDSTDVAVEQQDWLWLDQNQSPPLRHGVERVDDVSHLAGFMSAEFTRSVAIVTPAGIESFLRVLSGAMMDEPY